LQIDGVNYGEIFSPIVKLNSIRLVLFVPDAYNLEVEQLDVKTSFLLGDLDKNIYTKQPEGFVIKGKKRFCLQIKQVFI